MKTESRASNSMNDIKNEWNWNNNNLFSKAGGAYNSILFDDVWFDYD